MLIQPLPDPAADREQARRHPDQSTLELAAAGAALTLGPDHSATKALTKVIDSRTASEFGRQCIQTPKRVVTIHHWKQ